MLEAIARCAMDIVCLVVILATLLRPRNITHPGERTHDFINNNALSSI